MNQDPQLDRSTLTGIFLITLIMGAWLLFFQPQPPVEAEGETAPEVVQEEPAFESPAVERMVPTDSAFAAVATGEARTITVENGLYRAAFSTRGGTLTSFQLAEYAVSSEEGQPVELISEPDGALGLGFTPPQGSFVDTRSLYFRTPFEGDRLAVADEPRELVFEAPIEEGVLRYVYTFAPDRYEVGFRIEQEGADLLSASGGYELVWDGDVPFAEASAKDEFPASGAFARSGGEIEKVTLLKETSGAERLTGSVEWVAVKNKYFAVVLLPQSPTEGAELEGERIGEAGEAEFEEDFSIRLAMPRPRGETDAFLLYLGPLELERIERYAAGIYDIVDYGFGGFITRPIAEFVIAPLFRLLGSFLPNYGLVIILFGILIKLALYPLTKASYKNTARMRELQPKLEAVKEKYGDDPQKQQEAMMRVYRETGVNPLAGCVPMLLQYPIIIALWRYFQNSIVIRQESFLWAQDLSAPDPILQLPFSIPLYGDFVAGFTLLMGLVMMVQMQVAMPPSAAGGAQAKIFQYVLPIVLFVIFNRLASGLSLYYLVFNLLTIVQQKLINKEVHEQVEEEKQQQGKRGRAAGKNGRARTNGRNGQAKGKKPRRPKKARP